MKNQYLTHNLIKSHAIQLKAIKDDKDSKNSPSSILKLSKSTDIVSWMDRGGKAFVRYLAKIIPYSYISFVMIL